LFNYPTMLEILTLLKGFVKDKYQVNKQFFRTIKKGIIDVKDEYPLLSIEPEYERITHYGSSGQFIIHRKVNLVSWISEFSQASLKDTIRKFATDFKEEIKPLTDDWMLLDSNNLLNVFNIDFDPEIMGEPMSIERLWVQKYVFPIILSSYFTFPDTKVIRQSLVKTDYDDVLNTAFTLAKNELAFKKLYKQVLTPTDIENLPGLYIGFRQPEADRNKFTATETIDAFMEFEIYDFLATKEIALERHLENVYRVFNLILKYEDLDGRLEVFQPEEIHYGITEFENSKPVFSSTISTQGYFNNDLYLT